MDSNGLFCCFFHNKSVGVGVSVSVGVGVSVGIV